MGIIIYNGSRMITYRIRIYIEINYTVVAAANGGAVVLDINRIWVTRKYEIKNVTKWWIIQSSRFINKLGQT